MDFSLLVKEARLLLPVIANQEGISIAPGVRDAIPSLLSSQRKEIVKNFRNGGGWDLSGWRDRVRAIGAELARTLKTRNRPWLYTPRELERIAGPVIQKSCN